jgi:hypothetical protein
MQQSSGCVADDRPGIVGTPTCHVELHEQPRGQCCSRVVSEGFSHLNLKEDSRSKEYSMNQKRKSEESHYHDRVRSSVVDCMHGNRQEAARSWCTGGQGALAGNAPYNVPVNKVTLCFIFV